jgi:ankyrin repeat protein
MWVRSSRGKTALHLASENNHTQVVRVLLREGTDPTATSDGGWTALHNAAKRGHHRIVDLLLYHGADPNVATERHETPLHWAAFNGHIPVIKLLLGHPTINRHVKDVGGSTPLSLAATNHHIATMQLLSPSTDGSMLSSNVEMVCKEYYGTITDFFPRETDRRRDFFETNSRTVFDLLYGKKPKSGKPLVPTLVQNVKGKPAFRWIHLPANNVGIVPLIY